MDFSRRNKTPHRVDWFDDFVGDNSFRFLSNFYQGEPIEYLDTSFQTGEHLFAALKADSRKDFEAIAEAMYPSAAKAEGRRIDLRHDWEKVKYDAMRYVLFLKFHPSRPEANMLVDTGKKLLVEGTDWNDKVWGVNRSNGLGRNWLGVLLMARRTELVAEAAGLEPFDYAETKRFIQPGWFKREGDKR